MSEQTDEPEDAGDDEGVPADLVQLHEVLEWEAAESEGKQE